MSMGLIQLKYFQDGGSHYIIIFLDNEEKSAQFVYNVLSILNYVESVRYNCANVINYLKTGQQLLLEIRRIIQKVLVTCTYPILRFFIYKVTKKYLKPHHQ